MDIIPKVSKEYGEVKLLIKPIDNVADFIISLYLSPFTKHINITKNR